MFQSEVALQSALHSAVWSTLQDTTVKITDDINGFTESVVDLICKTTEATVPKTTAKLFHKEKPWIARTIWDAINTCTAGYTDNYKTEAYNVRRAVKEAKGTT